MSQRDQTSAPNFTLKVTGGVQQQSLAWHLELNKYLITFEFLGCVSVCVCGVCFHA